MRRFARRVVMRLSAPPLELIQRQFDVLHAEVNDLRLSQQALLDTIAALGDTINRLERAARDR